VAGVQDLRPIGTPIEIWFQDEARIGQKTKITRRWAKRGTRPTVPKDQRTRLAYLLGLDIGIAPLYGFGVGHSVVFSIEYLKAYPKQPTLNMS